MSIKSRIISIKEDYELYSSLRDKLISISDTDNTTNGYANSYRRQMVFLKQKIESKLKKIQKDMQPRIFIVSVLTNDGHEIDLLMKSNDKEDIEQYIHYMSGINNNKYQIKSIKEIPTVIYRK